jgi:hypothetical protein
LSFWTVAEIFRLMAIASQLSGAPMADNIPFVFIDTDDEIQRQVCAYNHIHCVAAYAFMQGGIGEIHLSDDLGPYSKNAVLVHELTHWLEYEANLNQDNGCKDERLALQTEARYTLRYEHIDRHDPPLRCP